MGEAGWGTVGGGEGGTRAEGRARAIVLGIIIIIVVVGIIPDTGEAVVLYWNTKIWKRQGLVSVRRDVLMPHVA